MNELVKQDDGTHALMEIQNTQKMCELLLRSNHYARLGPDGIYAIVAKARSLGVNPLEALNGGFYYVQGKVGMSSEMMASLIRQRGHSILKDEKSCNQICILHGRRADNGDTWTVSFSMEDAKRAGLAKNMYDKYPGIMLYNRALSMLARQLFPDIIKGAGYTMDELREATDPRPPQLQVEIEYITKEQAEELQEILYECTAEYQAQVKEFMKRSPINATSLMELPLKYYDRLKSAALTKREEAMKQLELEDQQAVVGEN